MNHEEYVPRRVSWAVGEWKDGSGIVVFFEKFELPIVHDYYLVRLGSEHMERIYQTRELWRIRGPLLVRKGLSRNVEVYYDVQLRDE